MRYTSIADMGGIEIYLESTREFHNGFSYSDLLLFLKLNIPRSVIAKVFKVDHRTIKRWKSIIEEENHET